MRKTILILLALFSFCQTFAQTKKSGTYQIQHTDNSLLWEVSGNGLKNPSFLYGTFHLMCKKDLVFSEHLKSALYASDVLMLELDMDDPKIAMGGLMSLSMKGNKKIKDLLSESDYKKVSDYFKDSLNTPIFWLESVQPMLLQSLLYTKLIPCASVTSPEQELMKLAKPQRKPVEGLETIEFQASVFEKIPYDVQATMLVTAIDSLAFQRESFKGMIDAYLKQDLKQLDSLASNEPGMKSFEDDLLFDRNKKWVDFLNDAMKEKSYFIAVGAGHLPRQSGVIELLRKKGFSVKPIVNSN